MEDEQDLVAALLRSTPPLGVRGDFVARVNARIDATAGWFGLADFRAWTLRLVPAAAALALIAMFWSAPDATPAVSIPATAAAPSFSPSSSADWSTGAWKDASRFRSRVSSQS